MDFKILLKILPFILLLLAGRYLKEASAATAAAGKSVEVLAHNAVQPVNLMVVATAKETKPLNGKSL